MRSLRRVAIVAIMGMPATFAWSGGNGLLHRPCSSSPAASSHAARPARVSRLAREGVRGATAELKNGMIKVFAGNGISGQMLPASMTGGFWKGCTFLSLQRLQPFGAEVEESMGSAEMLLTAAAAAQWVWHDGEFREVKHDGVPSGDTTEGWVDPFRSVPPSSLCGPRSLLACRQRTQCTRYSALSAERRRQF